MARNPNSPPAPGGSGRPATGAAPCKKPPPWPAAWAATCPTTCAASWPPSTPPSSTGARPFFRHLAAQQTDPYGPPGVAIYLTDGYGPFPTEAPGLPTLWVVTAGGLALAEFPFGEAVRLG